MAKTPQVFQPKIIVHQGGVNAMCPPSTPFSAFKSPSKSKSYSQFSSRTPSYSLCRSGTALGSYGASYTLSAGSYQAPNTLLNELYYQAFKTGFPSLLDQCQPFSERKSVVKRFICSYPGCGKMFGRNEEKTRHEKIHSGLRPYACELCSKRFGRKDHLTQHMRTHNRNRKENDRNSRNTEGSRSNERT